MTTPLPDTAAVRLAIERRFRKFGPSVDEAMVIVETALGERDDEIRRLSAACGEDSSGEEEHCVTDLGEPPPGALL